MRIHLGSGNGSVEHRQHVSFIHSYCRRTTSLKGVAKFWYLRAMVHIFIASRRVAEIRELSRGSGRTLISHLIVTQACRTRPGMHGKRWQLLTNQRFHELYLAFHEIILRYSESNEIVSLFTKHLLRMLIKVVIDPSFVCSYNTNMILMYAGFFRPDHDPPPNVL
jgi:hypothetical protein